MDPNCPFHIADENGMPSRLPPYHAAIVLDNTHKMAKTMNKLAMFRKHGPKIPRMRRLKKHDYA